MDCAVCLFLDLDSQEVPYISLVIDGELLGAGVQVSHYLVDGPCVRAEHDAVIDVYQEEDGASIIEAGIKFAWCKANFSHALVHILTPSAASLFLPIHVAYEF